MAGPEAALRAASLDPGTRVGAVELTVSDLGRSQHFYEQVIGLRSLPRAVGAASDTVALGAASDAEPLVVLHGDPDAPARPAHTTGLFHLAVLVPTRAELARSLTRLAEQRWPLDGASDHLVSEALYLSDPEGNGIEIYRDLPQAEWRRHDGQIEMATLPLDLRSILSELPEPPVPGEPVARATTIGHVHLQVADLGAAEAFYCGVLGFEVTLLGYPGALFISAGGYHHHIGLNTWHSRGAPAPPAGSVGLRQFDVVIPNGAELDRVLDRVRAAGAPIDSTGGGWALVRDPCAAGVRLRAA